MFGSHLVPLVCRVGSTSPKGLQWDIKVLRPSSHPTSKELGRFFYMEGASMSKTLAEQQLLWYEASCWALGMFLLLKESEA